MKFNFDFRDDSDGDLTKEKKSKKASKILKLIGTTSFFLLTIFAIGLLGFKLFLAGVIVIPILLLTSVSFNVEKSYIGAETRRKEFIEEWDNKVYNGDRLQDIVVLADKLKLNKEEMDNLLENIEYDQEKFQKILEDVTSISGRKIEKVKEKLNSKLEDGDNSLINELDNISNTLDKIEADKEMLNLAIEREREKDMEKSLEVEKLENKEKIKIKEVNYR